MDEIPAPPKGLFGPAGRALWRRMHRALVTDEEAEFELAFSDQELETLRLACGIADDIAALQRNVKAVGATVKGSTGQRRLNPAIPELRAQRLALAKLLGELPDPSVDEQPMTQAQLRAKHAAETRWTAERMQRGQTTLGVIEGGGEGGA